MVEVTFEFNTIYNKFYSLVETKGYMFIQDAFDIWTTNFWCVILGSQVWSLNKMNYFHKRL